MNLLNVLAGWLFLLIGLAVSIGLHEIGHLWPAKKFGVKVTKYMIGFGPTIFSRKRGETEYGIKAIPLGGYIQMVGMLPPEDTSKKSNAWRKLVSTIRATEPKEDSDDARAFYRLKPWQKLIVMFGGPFANLLIATFLTLVLFTGFGAYERITTIQGVVNCVPTNTNPNCDQVGDPSPASLAGLEAGDVILSVDSTQVYKWSEVQAVIDNKVGQSVTLEVKRGAETKSIQITPTQIDLGSGKRTYLGVYLESKRFSQSPVQALGNLGTMLVGTGQMIVQLPAQAVSAFAEITPGATRNQEGAISIIGLGQVSSELVGDNQMSIEDKVLSQLSMIMSLNVALFVFNMIPLVPLDGGHIAGAFYESLKRGVWRIRGKKLDKPVDTGLMMPVAYFVATLLLALTVVLMLRDILNPIHL